MQYLLILALVIAILSVVFALQNAVVIPVSLLFWEVRSSLALSFINNPGIRNYCWVTGYGSQLDQKKHQAFSTTQKN